MSHDHDDCVSCRNCCAGRWPVDSGMAIIYIDQEENVNERSPLKNAFESKAPELDCARRSQKEAIPGSEIDYLLPSRAATKTH